MKIQAKRLPEANIQAELYCTLKHLGIPTILEYKTSHCRFDLLVLDGNNEVLIIVEIKSYSVPKEPNYNTKQIRKYKQFGIPVLICGRFEDVPKVVEEIKALL